MKIIANVFNGFNEKFGVPRQSGLTDILSEIVFKPEYRVREDFYRLEEFSHLWIIWKFSLAEKDDWSPTVRPPKLGGNERVGVFASRSPFRPNPIGLSCVKLEKIDYDRKDSPVLVVSGADIVSGTPVYDVKPYIPYADCVPYASGGYSVDGDKAATEVIFTEKILKDTIDNERLLCEIEEILKQNPRPAYKKDGDRVYKMSYRNKTLSFIYSEEKIIALSFE